MAIYIPLEAALELCDKIEENVRGKYENDKFYISYNQIGLIFSIIAGKCGKYIPDDNEVLFAPQILPESADPKGSKRYKCYIRNEKYPYNGEYKVNYDLNTNSKSNTFTIRESSVDFAKYDVVSGMGTVIQEPNGEYSWWFDDMNKGLDLKDVE